MKDNFVSIIINVRNGAEFIDQAIDSALKQTHTDFEILIFDNMSTDNTADIVRSRSKCESAIRYYCASHSVPLYGARNQAMALCRGRFVGFLDCDDTWHPDKLAKQLELFNKTEAGIVVSNFDILNQSDGVVTSSNCKTGWRTESDICRYYDIALVTILIDRWQFPKNHIFFDSRYSIIGDFDFVVRSIRQVKVFCLKDRLATYRSHSKNFSVMNRDLHRSESMIWLKEQERILAKADYKGVSTQIYYSAVCSLFRAKRYREGMLTLFSIRDSLLFIKATLVLCVVLTRRY